MLRPDNLRPLGVFALGPCLDGAAVKAVDKHQTRICKRIINAIGCVNVKMGWCCNCICHAGIARPDPKTPILGEEKCPMLPKSTSHQLEGGSRGGTAAVARHGIKNLINYLVAAAILASDDTHTIKAPPDKPKLGRS